MRDPSRQHALIFEQGQLIRELRLLEEHLGQIDAEARRLVEGAREGRILTSIPGIGTIPAGAMLAAIGHIDNFRSAAALKAYFGWAPAVRQSGTSRYQAALGPGGTRPMKQMLYLVALKAVRHDGEWKRLYERLVPRKCAYDERTKTYRGRMKVLGRIAGQIATMVFALLKADQELLQHTPPGAPFPDPQLYEAVIHRAHRDGAYRPLKPVRRPGSITQLPGT